jgi:hypothetical protein
MLGKMMGIDPKMLKKDYSSKKVKEYKGSLAEETYSSKKAMAKHEKKEGKKQEAKEERLSKLKKRGRKR